MHRLEPVHSKRRSHPSVPPQYSFPLCPFGTLKLPLKLLQRSLNKLDTKRD